LRAVVGQAKEKERERVCVCVNERERESERKRVEKREGKAPEARFGFLDCNS